MRSLEVDRGVTETIVFGTRHSSGLLSVSEVGCTICWDFTSDCSRLLTI